MRNSKLIEILKTFSKEELKSFKKFIISPYFTVRNVEGLFTIIKKYHPEFNSERLTKKAVYEKLFPSEPYNEKKLKNLVVDLTRLAEKFIVYNSLDAQPNEYDRFLAAEYKNRKNDRLFFRTIKALEEHSGGKHFGSTECFSDDEKIERLKESYYGSRNRFDKSIPSRLKYTELFTASFLIRFLRKLRDKLRVKEGYNMPFESPLLESVLESIDFDRMLKLLKEKNDPYLWLVEIYYYVYKSAYEETGSRYYYSRLKESFLENIEKFSHSEKYFLFNDLVDCCIKKEALGSKEFQKEEMEIYKQMFSHNAYSANENEYLSVVLYRNILLHSLTVKDYQWLDSFIKNFTSKLRPEYRSSMMNLAFANLHFEKGESDKSLSCIRNIEFDFFLYKTDIRTLTLKIYYELNLYEAAFSLIDSFRHFLADTDEISGHIIYRHQNFLGFYNRIIKAKSSGETGDVDFILKDISSQKEIASKSWLLKKAEELLALSGK